MSKTSQVQVQVTVTGDGISGEVWTPPASPMVNSACPQAAPGANITMVAGLNNVPVPAGSTALVLSRTPGNANVIYAGTTSAGGFNLGTSGTPVLPLGGAPSTVPFWSVGGEVVAAAWG